MTSLRTIRAIEDDIAARKEAFDRRYLEGEFYDRFSRLSLQHQWQLLNKAIAPLVAELHETEKFMETLRGEIAWQQITKSQWRTKRKDDAA